MFVHYVKCNSQYQPIIFIENTNALGRKLFSTLPLHHTYSDFAKLQNKTFVLFDIITANIKEILTCHLCPKNDTTDKSKCIT